MPNSVYCYMRFTSCQQPLFTSQCCVIFFGGYLILEQNSSNSCRLNRCTEVWDVLRVACLQEEAKLIDFPSIHSRLLDGSPASRLPLAIRENEDNSVKLSNSLVLRKEHGRKCYSMSRYLNLHCQICVQLSCYLQHLAAIWTDAKFCLSFQNKKTDR